MSRLTRTGTDVKGRDNYDTSSSATHYGKGSITRPTNYEKFADGWDRIFGKKEELPIEAEQPEEQVKPYVLY